MKHADSQKQKREGRAVSASFPYTGRRAARRVPFLCRFARGRSPLARQKAVQLGLALLSNETRFAGLSFEKAAARRSALAYARTFASRKVFLPTYTPPAKMFCTLFAPAGANSARLFRRAVQGGAGAPALRFSFIRWDALAIGGEARYTV